MLVFRGNRRRWSSNPSERFSYERSTRGKLCGTMRSMCGADAGCFAINYQALFRGYHKVCDEHEAEAKLVPGGGLRVEGSDFEV